MASELQKTPKTLDEVPENPLIRHFDVKTIKAKEVLVFMEETKIWQNVLQDCIERSGTDSARMCKQLHEMVQERNVYYNSRFNPDLRPKMTPGLLEEFECKPGPSDG